MDATVQFDSIDWRQNFNSELEWESEFVRHEIQNGIDVQFNVILARKMISLSLCRTNERSSCAHFSIQHLGWFHSIGDPIFICSTK